MVCFRRTLRWSSFTFILIANPAYFSGCSGGSDFSYGEAEMVTLLESVNEPTVWDMGEYELALDLEQQSSAVAAASPELGIIRSAAACESRTFVKSAAACMDTTELPVEGGATVFVKHEDGTTEQLATLDATGTLLATGLDLEQAELILSFESDSSSGSALLYWRGGDAFQLRNFSAGALGSEQVSIDYQVQ